MIPLIFILGTLVGILAGGALCVRYLRREIAADIGPQLKRMQNQLDNIESAINLALVTRYAELSEAIIRPRFRRRELATAANPATALLLGWTLKEAARQAPEACYRSLARSSFPQVKSPA